MSTATDADANRIFAVAWQLAEQATVTNEEILYRIAVGRAYYSLLLTASIRCGTVGSENVHEQVYLKCRRAMGEIVADRIKAMKRYRVAADYFVPPDGFAAGAPDGSDWSDVWQFVNYWTPRLTERIRAVRSWP